MRVLVGVVVIALSGCFTTIGAVAGGFGAERVPVEYEERHEVVRARPIPTAEQRTACEARRSELSARAAASGDPQERATVLASMPNCLDVYSLTDTPPPLPVPAVTARPIRWERRSGDIALGAVAGGLIGAALDVTAVVLVATQSL